MRLSSVHLVNFRSYTDTTVNLDHPITTLVGENNTGKSSISLAVARIIGRAFDGASDFPYNQLTTTIVSLEFTFDDSELDNFHRYIGFIQPEHQYDDSAHQWLRSLGNKVIINLKQNSKMSALSMEIGNVQFVNNAFTMDLPIPDAPSSVQGGNRPDLNGIFASKQEAPGTWLGLSWDVTGQAVTFFTERLKRMEEFRTRAQAGARSPAIETLTGSETASVLLNLKNHRSPKERQRYRDIVEAFKLLFPRYTDVEATEESPGSGVPSIQFMEGDREPLSLNLMSAGVHQVLGFLVNLIGMEDRVVFIEHPEQHLHPHGMRFLLSIIKEASEHNQVVLITHDPHFVNSDDVLGLKRVWWSSSGSQVRDLTLDPNRSARQLGQIQTALKSPAVREAVFARAVIVVEDESQRNFLIGVAPTLGFNLDAFGISILQVDGERNYTPLFTFLNALGIPYIGLKDKPWSDPIYYPPERFFSFGCELEEYLDEHGLAEERQQVMAERGTSKQRAAGKLAERLPQSEVPELFSTLLRAAQTQATGEPFSI